MRLSRSAILGAALLFVIPGPIQGQFNDTVLAGVGEVNGQIQLDWNLSLPGSESTTKARLQTLFELELRKASIVVSTEAPNFLTIVLNVIDLTSQAGDDNGCGLLV